MNNERCYELYKECFPALPLTFEGFLRLSEISEGTVICDEGENGFALVVNNCVRLLCVSQTARNRGIGSKLLKKAEERISADYDSVCIGGDSRIFYGAVDNTCDFFSKRGYKLTESYAEMKRSVQDFSADDFSLQAPDFIRFGWHEGDICSLVKAVESVDPKWVKYFDGERVFCAYAGNDIAGFCIVSGDEECILSDGRTAVGVIGCVGTVPHYRRKGIGLKMVALAMEELKNSGSDICFIHYTGVMNWYARLGFEAFLFQTPAQKKLK